MANTNQREYREVLYRNYASSWATLTGFQHSESDYQHWANAIRHRIRWWLPSDRCADILDMGCGSGNFLRYLEELGYSSLTGVDVSLEQVTLARQKCKVATVLHGNVQQVLAQYPGRFDLITGFDVLEHFRKEEILPLLFLVSNGLRHGGRVILQTPNGESPWIGAVGYSDFTHEWFYTPLGLSHLLAQVGLQRFEARPSGPIVHGIKSLARGMLWYLIHLLLVLWNISETGTKGSGIYTRVFIATALKI